MGGARDRSGIQNWPNNYPATLKGKDAIIYPQTYSEADMDRLTDYLIEYEPLEAISQPFLNTDDLQWPRLVIPR